MGNTKIKIPNIDGSLSSAFVKIPNIDGEITKIYVGNDLVYQKITATTITTYAVDSQAYPSLKSGNVGTSDTFYFTIPNPTQTYGIVYEFSSCILKGDNTNTTYYSIDRTSTSTIPQDSPDLFKGLPYVPITVTYQSENCTLRFDMVPYRIDTASFSVTILSRRLTASTTFALDDIVSRLSISNVGGRYLTFIGNTGTLNTFNSTVRAPARGDSDVVINQYTSGTVTTTLTMNNVGEFTLTATRSIATTGSTTVTLNISRLIYW